MRNNRFHKAFTCILFILGLATGVSGQYRDAGLWINATVEKKIVKGLDLVLTEELRLNENITEAGAIFTEVGLDYRLYKRIRAGIYYRFINRRNVNDTYRQSHRFFLELSYKPRIERFEIGYRIRFQAQFTDINKRQEGTIPEWYMRHKLQLAYNTKSRFDPYISGELWFNLDPLQAEIENLRLTLGIETRITKAHSIDCGYIFQRQYLEMPDEEDYILFIGYKVSF